FIPPLDNSVNRQSVSENVALWLDECITISNEITPLRKDCTFEPGLRRNTEIGQLHERIWAVVDASIDLCRQAVPAFEAFGRLWEQDATRVFEEFLASGGRSHGAGTAFSKVTSVKTAKAGTVPGSGESVTSGDDQATF